MKIYRPQGSSFAKIRPARALLGSGAAFREQETGRRRNWWRLLFFLSLGGGVVYGLFFSPLFFIRSYRLILTPRLPALEVRKIAEQTFSKETPWWSRPRRTVWAYPKKRLQESFKNIFGVRDVNFDYRWWKRELVISVTEREPALAIVWQDGLTDIYDQDQKFLENAPLEKYNDRSFPIINYPASKLIKEGQGQVFTPEEWKFWHAVWEKLRTLGLEPRSMSKLELITDDVKSTMAQGYEIIWDPVEDVQKQFSRLKVILDQMPDKKSLHYIDVRFEGKAIYQ